MRIKTRTPNQSVFTECLKYGFPEITARILANRTDVFDPAIIDPGPACVTPAMTMADCPKAAERIAKAIQENQKILLFTDYDVDGCTSMAILFRALKDGFKMSERQIIQLVGHRTKDGYGITDTVADKIIGHAPDLVITADAGSSDHGRLSKLSKAGIDVIVTDHHLMPEAGIPEAAFAVVNPQRDDCPYDTNIAGCGVAWLLMTAVCQQLQGDGPARQILFQLLDFVALGTVADMVKLNSPINRYFVKKGLGFMNQAQRECWRLALYGRTANVGTLGFQIGPRINAASRMTGRSDIANQYLISEDPNILESAYNAMDQFNSRRKKIEQDMINIAAQQYNPGDPCIIAYHESFDPGVQGIVASKLVERFGVPAIMLANIPDTDALAGSGRAGQFLHLRDALQAVEHQHPEFFISFGGHKAAAGLKFKAEKLGLFKKLFTKAVEQQLDGQDSTPFIQTDGSLKGFLNLNTHHQIHSLAPFGMGFPTPSFCDTFTVTGAQMVGQTKVHLSLQLDHIKAIQFFAVESPGDPMPVKVGDEVQVVYQTDSNFWNGQDNLQLVVKKIEKTN